MTAPMRNRRVVFVLSAPHSGSTWVGYVLGSHSASAFLGEFERGWREEAKVPCTLCATRGLPECEVLGGIDSVAPDQAYEWAFDRVNKPVLIDISKLCAWSQRHMQGDHTFQPVLIHLIRDPRSWMASMLRRDIQPVDAFMRLWCETNTQIHAFVQHSGCRSATVFYDELAADPVREFRRLFAVCGLPFERSALEYWHAEHHGFAANGASSAIFAGHRLGPPPPHFRTADDAFYATHDRTMFVDRRWLHDLGAGDIARISADPEIGTLLAKFGRRLTPDGIVATGSVHGIRRLAAWWRGEPSQLAIRRLRRMGPRLLHRIRNFRRKDAIGGPGE